MKPKTDTLTLTLKRKWFDMIKQGIKKEEYREIKPYWIKRFIEDVFDAKRAHFRRFDSLVFTLGYPVADDSEKRIEFKNPRIDIRTGKPEWGAAKGVQYFVITWEE